MSSNPMFSTGSTAEGVGDAASGGESEAADKGAAKPTHEQQVARFQAVELIRRSDLRKIVDNWQCLPVSAATREKMEATWTDGMGRECKPVHHVQALLDACNPTEHPETGLGTVKVAYRRILGELGRQYATGPSLQTIQRNVRHTIAAGLYKDLDVENCHPTLLAQYCERHGIQAPKVTAYAADREAWLARLRAPRDEAKRVVLTVLYGGWAEASALPGGAPDWLCELSKELKRIASAMISSGRHAATVSSARARIDRKLQRKGKTSRDKGLGACNAGSGNLEGSVVSAIMQEEEDCVLQAIVERLRERGISVAGVTLIFDGLMVPCSALESAGEMGALLRDLEFAVERSTGYRVRLAEKAMDETIDLSGLKAMVADPTWSSSMMAFQAQEATSRGAHTLHASTVYGTATGVVVARRSPYGLSAPANSASTKSLFANRQYARLQSGAEVDAIAEHSHVHSGSDLVEVLESGRPVHVFFRLAFPRVHTHAADAVIAQFMEAGVRPILGPDVSHTVAVSHNSIVASVRIVLDARVPSLVECYRVCSCIEGRVLALRWRFPALRMHTCDATPMDMSIYHEGSHLPIIGSIDPNTTQPLVPGASAPIMASCHLVTVLNPAVSVMDCDAWLRWLSTGAEAFPDSATPRRTLARTPIRPFSSAERAQESAELNRFEGMRDVFGGCDVSVDSVTHEGGVAVMELAESTPCPFVADHDSCALVDALGRLSLESDEDQGERHRITVRVHESLSSSHSSSANPTFARITCSHSECCGRQTLVRKSGSSRSAALDRVCVGTLHTQELGVEWGMRYSEPAMRPLAECGWTSHRDEHAATGTENQQGRGSRISGLMCVMGGMGIGKTKALVDFIRATCNAQTSILAISHSVALSARTNASLCEGTGLEFTLYSDVPPKTQPAILHPRVTVCLDSLRRCAMSAYDLVVVDEVCSVMAHFNSKLMIDTDLVSHKLERVLTNARRVVFLDAVCDSTLVKLAVDRLESLRNERAFWVRNDYVRPTNRHMRMLVDRGPRFAGCGGALRESSMHFRAMNAAFSRIRAGENVVFVSNIKTLVVAVADAFKQTEEFAGLDFKAYYGDGPIKLKCAATEWQGLRLLAYSPTITAGVSFEAHHFHSLVAYFDGGPHAPGVETIVQMLWRVRDLSSGAMEVFYMPAAPASTSYAGASELETPRGVSERLLDGQALTRRYLDEMHCRFTPSHTLADDGSAPFDQTRLSWDVLVGSLVAKHRSLAHGAELLAATVRNDYGVPVTVADVNASGEARDGDLVGREGLALHLANDCIKRAQEINAVPYENLDLDLIQSDARRDAVRETVRHEGGTAEQKASLALVDAVAAWEMVDPAAVDADFYRDHVLGGHKVLGRVRGWALRIHGGTSELLTARFSKELTRVFQQGDPNFDLHKRARRWLKTIIHAQELAEAVLDRDQALALNSRPLCEGTGAQIDVLCAPLCEAVEGVLDRYTAAQKLEMSSLLFDKKGARNAFKWCAKALEMAFHVRMERCNPRKGTPGYERATIDSRKVWGLIHKYKPDFVE